MPARCEDPIETPIDTTIEAAVETLVEPPTPWHAVSRRGPRRVNADATAVYRDPVTGRSAYAVADGVGDTEAAAEAARLAVRVAAVTAITDGPEAAVFAAQQALRDVEGDCVLAVVVPDGHSCEVAWVGDCRVYYSNGRVLQQVTVDHTVAEYYRARGRAVQPRMEHVVTTSVRTVKPEWVGTTRTSVATGRLLLCSDGLHRSLFAHEIQHVLDEPFAPDTVTHLLVDQALERDGKDNCTVLVVDHGSARARRDLLEVTAA